MPVGGELCRSLKRCPELFKGSDMLAFAKMKEQMPVYGFGAVDSELRHVQFGSSVVAKFDAKTLGRRERKEPQSVRCSDQKNRPSQCHLESENDDPSIPLRFRVFALKTALLRGKASPQSRKS
jgi:hypothetical protein